MERAWAASGSVRMLNSATAERLPVVIAPPISTTRRNLRFTCSEPMRSCCIRQITFACVLESISMRGPVTESAKFVLSLSEVTGWASVHALCTGECVCARTNNGCA